MGWQRRSGDTWEPLDKPTSLSCAESVAAFERATGRAHSRPLAAAAAAPPPPIPPEGVIVAPPGSLRRSWWGGRRSTQAGGLPA